MFFKRLTGITKSKHLLAGSLFSAHTLLSSSRGCWPVTDGATRALHPRAHRLIVACRSPATSGRGRSDCLHAWKKVISHVVWENYNYTHGLQQHAGEKDEHALWNFHQHLVKWRWVVVKMCSRYITCGVIKWKIWKWSDNPPQVCVGPLSVCSPAVLLLRFTLNYWQLTNETSSVNVSMRA